MSRSDELITMENPMLGRSKGRPNVAKKSNDLNSVSNEQSEKLDKPVKTLLNDNIVSFSDEEINSFVGFSKFFNGNPRKIKRITNIYTCVRMLLPDGTGGIFRKKLLGWITLCEQVRLLKAGGNVTKLQIYDEAKKSN